MKEDRLTWLDWTLIGLCIFLLLHMPTLLKMHYQAGIQSDAEAPFLAHGVSLR